MSNPLDTKVISKLAEILDKSNLTELEYEDEGCRICLTRDFSGRKLPGCVKSPMVGVVYLSADPNSPDYVKVGSTVAEGDTVCLIEAMKTFNPVKAHKGGKVTKILVAGGDPVEYGEPLIIIE